MPLDGPDYQSATDVAPIPLATLMMANGASLATASYTMPGTATGLQIVLPHVGQDATVTVTGDTTGRQYDLDIVTGTELGGVYALPVSGGVEASVTVGVSWSSNNVAGIPVACAYVAALTASGLTAVYTSHGRPLDVRSVIGPGLQMQTVSVNLAPATGVSTTIVAGVAGRVITVYGYELFLDPNNAATLGFYSATLQETGAAVIVARAQLHLVTAAGVVSVRAARAMPSGIALPVSAGLRILAGANAGVLDIVGNVDYVIV